MEEANAAPQRQPEKDKGGTWLPLGDEQFKVPPLGFKQVREFLPKLRMANALPTEEQLEITAAVLHAALQRNYPSLTRDDVDERLDMSNFRRALAAVMGVSGLEAKGTGPGEAAVPAESP